MGPKLPYDTTAPDCAFYFNIDGSFSDTSNIYLMVFVKNTFFILKNKKWIDEFPNKNKLKMYATLTGFGCDFMVCSFFFFQSVCVENIACKSYKNITQNKKKQQKIKKPKKSTMRGIIKL